MPLERAGVPHKSDVGWRRYVRESLAVRANQRRPSRNAGGLRCVSVLVAGDSVCQGS